MRLIEGPLQHLNTHAAYWLNLIVILKNCHQTVNQSKQILLGKSNYYQTYYQDIFSSLEFGLIGCFVKKPQSILSLISCNDNAYHYHEYYIALRERNSQKHNEIAVINLIIMSTGRLLMPKDTISTRNANDNHRWNCCSTHISDTVRTNEVNWISCIKIQAIYSNVGHQLRRFCGKISRKQCTLKLANRIKYRTNALDIRLNHNTMQTCIHVRVTSHVNWGCLIH